MPDFFLQVRHCCSDPNQSGPYLGSQESVRTLSRVARALCISGHGHPACMSRPALNHRQASQCLKLGLPKLAQAEGWRYPHFLFSIHFLCTMCISETGKTMNGPGPDVPDPPPRAHDIRNMLAVLFKGLQGFNTEELDIAEAQRVKYLSRKLWSCESEFNSYLHVF